MPIFFYGKEFTNIGSIGLKDKKTPPELLILNANWGRGERLEIRENFTSYPSKITKQKALQFLV